MSYLSPPAKFAATYVDLADGTVKPAVGYKLYTYAAGTSTPKDSYINAALTANTNPVILDARGECDLVLSGNYKLILKTDADVTVWTVDNITDLTSNGTFAAPTLTGALTVTSTAVTWSGNPTHSGNHTWSGNQVFNGNVTLGDAGSDTVTVNASTLTWPNSPTHSGNHTWSGAQTFNSTVTLSTGALISGTYSPTFTTVTNLDSTPVQLGVWRYLRIGNMVMGYGTFTYNPTATGNVNFRVSVPVASAFAAINDLAGSISCGTQPQEQSMVAVADIATDTMSIFIYSASTSSVTATVNFMYQVL